MEHLRISDLGHTRAVIERCIQVLSAEIGPRPAASRGQRRSAALIAGVFGECGFTVELQRTDCPRWELQGVSLRLGETELTALANPHSPSCHLSAPLVGAQSLAELESARLEGCIAVLYGDLTASSFNPKHFDVYRDEAQDGTIRTLEQKGPLAVVMVSGLEHPAALMEDSEFRIPSITVSRNVGAVLAAATGRMATLRIDANRQAGYAANIVARGAGVSERRLLVCAHYDTKFYTPGAVDNATGVAALVALAQLLHAQAATGGVELVAFGGEDSWYPCDVGYMQQNETYLHTVSTVINVDGIGVKGYQDSVAFLGCPEALVAGILKVKSGYPQITRVPPWYAGDHSLFWPRGIPSVAMTSEGSFDPHIRVAHTSLDTLDRVDPDRIEQTVQFLYEVVRKLQQTPSPPASSLADMQNP